MRKSSIFQLGLMAILAVACVAEPKEVPQVPGGEELVAGIENSGTRTVVNEDLQVLWETADQISVFLQTTENRPYELQGEGGVATGKFSRTTKQSPEYYATVPYNYGVYPYFSGTSISADGVITLELPAEQAYAENSFGPCANVMVAASEDKTLNFKNLNGYICVRLTGDVAVETVSLISNTGEMLAGTAQVTVKPDAEPVVTFAEEGGIGSVTVLCEKPVQLSSEETLFWVVVPPATYPEGFTLTVTYNGGQEFVLEGSSSLELARSTVVKMPVVNIVAPKTLPYAEPLTKEFGAFSADNVELDGLKFVWSIDSRFHVAKASAFVSDVAHKVKSRLVSPPIDLTAESTALLSFDFMLRYGTPASYNDQLYLEVIDGKTVTKVNIPEMPDYDPKFANMSSIIDLTPFCGKMIQVAFVYNTIENDGQIPTFEVSNVKFDRNLETVITALSALTLSVGDDPESLDASVNSGVELVYTSSDESVATVDAEGAVTPVAEGTATITITAPGLGLYAPAEATCAVTVIKPASYDVVPSWEYSFSKDGGYENAEELQPIEEKLFQISFAKGSNQNTPKYYTTGAAGRFYAGNTLTVTVAEGYKITSINFTTDSGEGTNDVTSDTGSCVAGGKGKGISWTGEIANGGSVTFTIAGTSGHRRIKSIAID